jgi:transglutaminase-like putative cysteine protease
VVLVNVVLFGAFVFVYVGGDIAQSVVPPLDVIDDIRHEMGDALSIFRSSPPPVSPLAGLVALIGGVLWALTALSVWGVLRNNPYLAVVPPVVFYLQLAVIDRQDAPWQWMVVFLVLVGFGLAAIAADQRSGGGHAGGGFQAARIRGVAVPLLSIVAVTAGAVAATSAVGDEVPAEGVFDWRSRAGIGAGYGSISYNPFLDMRRRLVSNSDTPVFTARLAGENTDNVYWRWLTMDTFRMDPDGEWWYPSRTELESLEDTNWEKEEFAFRGPTEAVSAEVTIAQLASRWLPAPYSPNKLDSPERLIRTTARVSPQDGSIKIDGVTQTEMVYMVQADIPQPDVGVLAGTGDGSLSPLFAAASKEGVFRSAPLPGSHLDLPDADFERYTALPDDFPPRIVDLARTLTLGLETDYEKGLALENFFRSPGNGFVYSIDIPSEEQNSPLEAWLLDDTPGTGYRTGYCEQFALSMAVMARTLGIPTRGVIGFTPGQRTSNGEIVVLDRNAHAWVELYMPSQGWVRFDPTPRGDGVNPSTSAEIAGLDRYLAQVAAEAQARLDNPAPGPATPPREPIEGERNPLPNPVRDPVSGDRLPSWLVPTIAWSVVVGVVVGTVPFVKRRRRRYRMRRLSDGDIDAAWAEMIDYLIDSGFAVNPATTPTELATATDTAMRPLASVYSESTYGPEQGMSTAAVEAATASLNATVDSLQGRMTRWERTRHLYRAKSLLPDWIKRTKQRRRRG